MEAKMKTLQEMYDLYNAKKLSPLTVEAAKELKGKKIQTIYFGYAHQDNTFEFVVGDLVSELEYYRNLKEECYPDKNGHKNRAEYWESYMTAEQLKERKDTLLLTDSEGKYTYIQYQPAYDCCKDHWMWCSDVDRGVSYIVVED